MLKELKKSLFSTKIFLLAYKVGGDYNLFVQTGIPLMVRCININNNNAKITRVIGTALGKPGCLFTPCYSSRKSSLERKAITSLF